MNQKQNLVERDPHRKSGENTKTAKPRWAGFCKATLIFV